MHCPACKDAVLVMSDRQGVEIDYCPKCRGVWLDRGELDKIIERSAGGGGAMGPGDRDPSRRDREHHRQDDDDDDRDDRHHRGPHRRKRGFLSELFDFD